MERAVLTLQNTAVNQEKSRQIRDYHKKNGQPLTIRFSEELTHIILEAPCLFLPAATQLDETAVVDGWIKECSDHLEIYPLQEGTTIQLRLDSELIKELKQIRTLVNRKTQAEVIQEMLMRGLRAFQEEQGKSSR